MNKKSIFWTLAALLILTVGCEKDDDDASSANAKVPSGAALIVDKNFQKSGYWPSVSSLSIGYATEGENCGTDNLLSSESATTWQEIYYNGVNNDTVLITFTDVALNTTCETGAGTTSDGGEITKGYVLFNQKTARNGEVVPSVELSAMASVSTVQFTLTAGSTEGKGIVLYKSVDGAVYKQVGVYKPQSTTTGEKFSVSINEENVALKFASEDTKNGFFRLHDLQVWTGGVPSGSVLYVEDYFYNWYLKGYQLPVPGVEANKTGTQYVPLASEGTVEYDTTITYYKNIPVTYTLHDAAVNPDCYNHHGDTTLVYGLTTGYIELPINKNAYSNKDINASLTISAVPSVSLIEFWVAVSGYSGRYSLYKSVNGGEYELYKDLIVPKYAGIGKYFRFYVNEKNVSFKFTTYQGEGAYTTTPKIYGVKIWSDGKP
ncbi:MAG: hypothetical protein QM786_11245 [Breznakibacter sp.]